MLCRKQGHYYLSLTLMPVRITCIRKDNGNHENPYVAISSFGWLNEQTAKQGESDRETMYDWVVNKRGQAYVRDARGNAAYLEGAISPRGTRFLRTVRDDVKSDNLLSLPECR